MPLYKIRKVMLVTALLAVLETLRKYPDKQQQLFADYYNYNYSSVYNTTVLSTNLKSYLQFYYEEILRIADDIYEELLRTLSDTILTNSNTAKG
jgi:hypothetical protein